MLVQMINSDTIAKMQRRKMQMQMHKCKGNMQMHQNVNANAKRKGMLANGNAKTQRHNAEYKDKWRQQCKIRIRRIANRLQSC